MEATHTLQLGKILVDSNHITQAQLEFALNQQKKTNRKLGAILLELGFITAEQLINAIDHQNSGYDIDLEQIYIPPEVPLLIPEKLARRHKIVPVKLEDGIITLAMENPMNIFAVDDVKLATGLRVKPVGASADSDLSRYRYLLRKKQR